MTEQELCAEERRLAADLHVTRRLLAKLEHRKILDIIHRVSLITGVPSSEILSKWRSRSRVRARMACYYLARRDTGASYPEIGDTMGRDHTTVISGERVFRAALERGDVWAMRIANGYEARAM